MTANMSQGTALRGWQVAMDRVRASHPANQLQQASKHDASIPLQVTAPSPSDEA